MTTHPFDALRRAPRNAREAHAEMTATAAKREASHADLRHLHRRAQSSPNWDQGHGPNQPEMSPEAVRWLRFFTLAFRWALGMAGIAIAVWMARAGA